MHNHTLGQLSAFTKQGLKTCTDMNRPLCKVLSTKLRSPWIQRAVSCVDNNRSLHVSDTPTWSISMSLGKAFGHSMATLTMSAGGGMAEVGWGVAQVPLPHTSVTTTGGSSSKPARVKRWRGWCGRRKGNGKTGNRAH